MAILGEIRNRPKVLIVIIALALLAFLIPELGGKGNSTNINSYGEVNGNEISRDDYDAMMLASRNQTQGRTPDNMLRQQAWETAVQNSIIKERFESTGLEMSDEVLFAFNPEFQKQIVDLQNAAKEGNQNAQANLKSAPTYVEAEKARLRAQLYNSILTAGMLTNKLEVKHALNNANNTANVQFVKVDYNAYNAKNPVKVTDEDLQAYINKHPLNFKREASTTFQYAMFRNTASAKDSARFKQNINAVLNGGVEIDEDGNVLDSIPSFRTYKNDSMYVSTYSSQPYNPGYFSAQQISQGFGKEVGDWAKSASEGAVYGPFAAQNYQVVTKLAGKKLTDSIETKHILISYKDIANSTATRSKEEAQALANDLLAKTNAANFDQMVKENSDDGSVQNGGNVGWTTKEQPKFVPEFQKYVEENPVGKIGLVESQFGYHIISVIQKKKFTSFKLASVFKENKVSDATSDILYKQANKFLSEVKGKSLNDFVTTAKKSNFAQSESKNTARFAGMIQGLNTDKDDEIIAWTFNPENKTGDTSIFTTTDGDYVVVRLTSRAEKGQAKPNEVKAEIENTVRNQLIAKQLETKLKGKSLSQIAKDYSSKVENAAVSFNQKTIGQAGYEPKVVGAAFGLKANATSTPIEGNAGVYVVKTTSFSKAPTPQNEQAIKPTLEIQNKQQTGIIIQSLRKEADINDNRTNIFK